MNIFWMDLVSSDSDILWMKIIINAFNSQRGSQRPGRCLFPKCEQKLCFNPSVKPTIFMKGGGGRGRSWGLSFHHPFEAGLLSSSVFHSSHHGAEIQSWQVSTGGKTWSAKHMHTNLEWSSILSWIPWFSKRANIKLGKKLKQKFWSSSV